MPKTNFGFSGGGHVGKISFEVQSVHAIDGPEFPKLIFTLDLQLSPLKTFSQPEKPEHPLTGCLTCSAATIDITVVDSDRR